MAATHGATAPALSPIVRSIREYSLFQGVQLVQERLRQAHPELDDEALYERLELQANPSMGFPGSEIESVEYFEERGELRARLRVNLVSLFGAGSPLPAFYGEQALGDGVDGNPTRMFMDLFNNRLQRLLLPVWQKYRYHARFKPGGRDPVSALLFSLIGLSGNTIRHSTELNWKRLLPYLGLLSLRAQSAAMVESVLRYYFKHEQLHIEQCLEREVDIPGDQRCQLGLGNSTLGDSLVLGERVRDRSGKFRIHILNLDWARFHDFLPPGCDNQPLRVLIRFVLRTPLDYDVRLHLRPDEIRELRLGAGNTCRLGWTSWLGCEHADAMVTLGSQPHQAL
ncbi:MULTISPECIES: type VI secretion system baseplate subunit TssG [Halopseudomonas]|uniref:Type VI secretion system baseplate subunit TssG n=1 Tax=Halopseudomonas bauzanensis TaxID=653930 RepID=A0A031MG19_9GAMM|nr:MULTISPECIES: type VI secretion system baseplate subunit TssG [Halopseudomonas]EZQ18373.1 type VI secretion protein [Halopseudomonas bauzanensis]TKA92550.1 type VI secretion system baseplate subunit TssG [Halopseudomonas bauzanensis]WGK62808.1 type VI secretion system baseplate subunit TssG [Halopseudomonas sp. SMJS2]SES21187.1 type VI secretion system protein ImpH [Halopseudomonas bauzanensis]SFM14838.1 type VI secretion system protein ImpH [Halopseudomonas bauzanensis]